MTLFRFIHGLFAYLLLPLVGGAMIVAGSLYLYLSPKLPSVETIRTVKLQIPLRIYSRDLHLIGEFGEKRRTPVAFEDLPPHFVQALLAAEDDDFYTHFGVDVKGLARAAVELATTGHIQSGGSTITMQLARNFYLSREQTFIRKFNEILLAMRIEVKLRKNEILTLYANLIYLGNRAYGVQAAAQAYYGKPIQELTLPQLAMIAGLPKAPSTYNPISNPARAVERRNWILGRMLKLGYIDQATYEQAVAADVGTVYHRPPTPFNTTPYVAEMARQQAVERLGVDAYTDGLSVVTTVDSTLQEVAQRAVRNGLIAYDRRHGYRGPERHFADPASWPKALGGGAIGGLTPAIVTRVDERQLELLLADNRTATLPWDAGLKDLRLYISENSRSAPIKRAAEAFKVGDLIRVEAAGDGWRLAQIPAAQSALISLDPDTGAIRALVGGFDFSQSHFNRAVQAQRQPGSSFKPFLYTIALEQGYTPATIVNDAPVVFDNPTTDTSWRPENDNGKFYGPISLRKALYLSRNMVSIRLMQSLGINRVVRGLARFGFSADELPRDLSLALGSHALTPLAIATGYATFANGGYRITPFLIDRIEDRDGAVVYQAQPAAVCRTCDAAVADAARAAAIPRIEAVTANAEATADVSPPLAMPSAPRVIDATTAYLLDSLLKDVIRKGTGRRALALKRADIAGKTGTTNGPKDAWFSGYNPHLVTTVWLGMDNSQPIGRGEYGGSAALPIWMEFMDAALKGTPEAYPPQPEGIVSVRIDPETGLRAYPGQGNAVFELFPANRVPPLAEARTLGYPQDDAPLPADLF